MTAALRHTNVVMHRKRLLTAARGRYLSGLAGQWREAHLPQPIRPSELQDVRACNAVYLPLRQRLVPERALLVDYVGSVARSKPNAVWQRVVSEHQTGHIERLLDWDLVAVIPLRRNTPIRAIRLIEAGVADAIGKPPKCVRLPKLPVDWRAELRRLPPTSG
jgi:hypothetical protein